MRKLLISGILVAAALGESFAGGIQKPLRVDKKPVRFESNRELMHKYAMLESSSNARTSATGTVSNKRKGKPNSVQASNVSFVDLGASVNPFTSVTSGRNYLSVDPTLNTVAFIRRGGGNEPGGATNAPGNKLVYDYSTQGGSDGSWQLSKGPLFSDDNYTGFPSYDAASSNFGPRYPQGALWNPAGNTDPANAIVMGTAAVLDGTNGTWGGMGRGWQKMGSSSPASEAYNPSGNELHYITDAMEVNANGDVFMSEAEVDASGAATSFTDKLIVYKFSYNSATGSFDSTITYIPFSNEGGDYASYVANTAISFAPNGQVGYLMVSGFNNAYDSLITLNAYISKTTDGGTTWSDFKLLPINYKNDYSPSLELDSLRNTMLSNYVRFTENGIISAQRGEEYAHRVDYFLKDFDLTVDRDGFAHILAQYCVTSFGDTIVNAPGDFVFYPGYGSWMVDLYINNFADDARGVMLGTTNAVRGCFGDCATAENIKEDSRPQVARSADGSVISFVWFDTDTAKHPQLTTDENSNPDLWIRSMQVQSPGTFRYSDIPRNTTKDSDNDGLIICGTVAPVMLNAPNGFEVAAAAVSLPATTVTNPWPTQHFFIKGLTVAASPDSFPVEAAGLLVKTNELVLNNSESLRISALPNPNSGNFALRIATPTSGSVSLTVYNTVGKQVYSAKFEMVKGQMSLPVQLHALPAGIYNVSVSQNGHIATARVLKN